MSRSGALALCRTRVRTTFAGCPGWRTTVAPSSSCDVQPTPSTRAPSRTPSTRSKCGTPRAAHSLRAAPPAEPHTCARQPIKRALREGGPLDHRRRKSLPGWGQHWRPRPQLVRHTRCETSRAGSTVLSTVRPAHSLSHARTLQAPPPTAPAQPMRPLARSNDELFSQGDGMFAHGTSYSASYVRASTPPLAAAGAQHQASDSYGSPPPEPYEDVDLESTYDSDYRRYPPQPIRQAFGSDSAESINQTNALPFEGECFTPH
eukprot:SAG11_NODE_5394_length_1573_cov_2.307327_2_plen_261_part_00